MTTATESKATPIPVDILLTHLRPGADEIQGMRLLRKYGEKYFPGVSKATVRLSEGVQPQPDAWFDALRILPVGVGKTVRFDEHKTDEERLEGECASTLIFKYLKLDADQTEKRITIEILYADSHKGIRETHFSGLVKRMNRLRADPKDGVVLKWAKRTLDALYQQLSLGMTAIEGEFDLKAYFNAYAQGGHFPDERARKCVERMVDRSIENERNSFLELAFLVRCWQRQGLDINVMLPLAFHTLYEDQVFFLAGVEECKVSKGWIEVDTMLRQKRKARILVIQSDNPLISSASRSKEGGRADVTLSRKTDGRVHIALNNPALNLVALTRMLRWLDNPKDKAGNPIKEVSWEELGKAGMVAEIPEWYFSRNSGMLMNGSENYPNTPITKIGTQALIDALYHAFHVHHICSWMRRRRVPIMEKKVQEEVEATLDATTCGSSQEPAQAA